MKTIQFIVYSLLLTVCYSVSAGVNDGERTQIEREVNAFFDEYLGVYNRRFGRSDRSAAFRKELGELVHTPLMQSPPMGPPMVPESMEAFTRGFEGFVSMLEEKEVRRLVWQQQEFQVLTPRKVLANNIGIGLTSDGQVAYETVSLYLLYRTEAGWKIAMFSPYDPDNPLHLGRP